MLKRSLSQKSKYNLGLWGIITIPTITILLWAISAPLIPRFSNLSNLILSMGQIFGLTGFTLFSLTLFLNTRLKILEEVFGGLNKVFPLHHLLGKVTFPLLLFHPLTLAFQRLFSSPNQLVFLLPGKSLDTTMGSISLLLLTLLLIFTIFIRLPYHIWIFTHQFLGVAYLFAIFHIFLIPSDVSFYQPLKIYMFILALIGSGAYLYRTVFKEWLVKKYPFTVEKINQLGQDVLEVVLTPTQQPLQFSPGQFIFIKFNQNNFPHEQHPFSITSSPNEKNLTLGIKILGDFTTQLPKLQKGTPALIEGPYGKFGQHCDPKRTQVWIAGGIGITPFLSLVKSWNTKKPPVELYYSIKTKEEAVFLQDLVKVSQQNPNIKVIPWCSVNQGHLTVTKVVSRSKNILEKEILLCGPLSMITGFKQDFLTLGIKEDQLHSEEFKLV